MGQVGLLRLVHRGEVIDFGWLSMVLGVGWWDGGMGCLMVVSYSG